MSEHQHRGRSAGRRPHSRPGRRYSQNNNSTGGQRNRKYSNSGQKRGNKKPVSFWKKLLNFFGIGKTSAKKPNKPKTPTAAKPVKSNTRIARTQDKPRQKKSPKLPVSVPRLYVGNLSYEANESDLEDLFKGIGSVRSVEIIYNPRTHKSKGYGFVEMRSMEDAYRSVEVLHGQPFMGRDLTVSAANDRDENGESRAPRDRQDDISEGDKEIKETVTPLVAISEEPVKEISLPLVDPAPAEETPSEQDKEKQEVIA